MLRSTIAIGFEHSFPFLEETNYEGKKARKCIPILYIPVRVYYLHEYGKKGKQYSSSAIVVHYRSS